MIYTTGKGISILKQEIAALVAFCDGKKDNASNISLRVHAGKLTAWASDGHNLAFATGEALSAEPTAGSETRPSKDEYEWQINYTALEAAAKTMGTKDEALLRVGRGGTIRDVKISDIESGEERCTVGIPAGSVGMQISIRGRVQVLVDSIRVQFDPSPTWAISPAALRLIGIAARACEATTVMIYTPRTPTDPVGVVIADGAWQLVLMPRPSEEHNQEATEPEEDP